MWDPGEVARILEAIDRGNPCGKRDYAIILLIARLGLRGVDVKRLEFADFDWPGNRLFVVQAKTGHRVQLPLLKEVGWAVIDYIRHGRPACDCPQVFLRHTAPIGPFSDQDHLHQILVKHARVAHVPVSEKRRHGMHSLRHTLATRLMEDGTPVEQIADILGHQSVQSTGVYLKSSLGLLAKCALDPDAPARRRRDEPSRITLAEAITALVAEKRAVGYKYDAEERVLARFAAFCRSRVPRAGGAHPGLGRGVDRRGPAAGGQAGDPAGPGRAGAGAGPLAWPPRRAGLRPARRGAAQARPLRPAHLHRPGAGGPVRPDRPLPLRLAGPVPAPGHAGAVPHDLRLRPARLRSPPAARRRRRPRRPGSCRSVTARAARTGRCPSASRCVNGSPATTPASPGARGGDWFFPGRAGQPLTLGNVDKNFRRFLWQARIPHGGRGHGPRVHDLRHAFAVNNLRSWFARGEDVGALLPVLQTYMGHSSIADTAYYLRLTAESYPHITARVQRALGDVVPPLTAGPCDGD